MLFAIKKILVCSDLSEHSDVVLKAAEAIRAKVNGELHLLHVTDIGLQLKLVSNDADNETYYDSIVGNISREIKSKLESQIKRTGVKAEAFIRSGHIADEINSIINKEGESYDILLIGHSSKTGLFQHFMGNVARKLVSTVSIPVFVIKKNMEFNKLAGFIDESMPSNWMITSTFDFYRSLSFKTIEFVSLWFDLPEPFLQEKKGKRHFETLEENIKYFVRGDENPIIRVEPTRELPVSNHLAKIMEEDRIDLAVLKRNKGLKINKIFIGSETMRMLETENINLLVLPV